MLVLARRLNEKIVIDGDIVITVIEIGRGQVRLGIEAPKDHRILRHELVLEVEAENQQAVAGVDAVASISALLAAAPEKRA